MAMINEEKKKASPHNVINRITKNNEHTRRHTINFKKWKL